MAQNTLVTKWAEQRIRSVVFAHVSGEHRQNLRFRGPSERKYSWRFSVDNVANCNIGELSSALSPFSVFLKAPSGNEVISSLEIYVPRGGGLSFLIASFALFGVGFIFTLIAIYLQIRDVAANAS